MDVCVLPLQMEAQLGTRICHTNGPCNAGSNDTDELECSGCQVRRRAVSGKDKSCNTGCAWGTDVDRIK